MKPSATPLQPGATLGMIGGGQLGRYFVIAARKLGYEVAVLDPAANAPAMQLASHKVVAAYDDAEALQRMAELCDVVTIEFENVPYQGLARLAERVPVAPSPECARIAQDRRLEKNTALSFGLTPAPFAAIESDDDIAAAVATTGLPAIIKTATLGYDGKGQVVCEDEAAVRQAFESLNGVACVLEQRIQLDKEVSVVLCRGFDGQVACFPVGENVHVNGVLDLSTVPASVDESLKQQVIEQAVKLAQGIDYVGVLGLEFFIDTQGRVFFNEMAPRPHNSGHYTLDATVTCQFEQQVRMVCGLASGSTELLTPVTMLNVLGDSWFPEAPDWAKVLAEPCARLHLYGKAEARSGRKMGHINCLSDSAESALALAERSRQLLNPR